MARFTIKQGGITMNDEMNNNPESFDPEEEVNSLSEGDIIEMIGDD